MKNLVLCEVEPDGLLFDVESTKTIFKDLNIIDTPAVWIYLGEWHIDEAHINRNNSRALLEYEMEVSCMCNLPDLLDSDAQATSLQARVMEALTRNWKRVVDKEYNILCQGITDVIGYSDGKINIASKQLTVAVKGVTCKVLFDIDWMRCLKKQEEQQEEQNTDDGNSDTGSDTGSDQDTNTDNTDNTG